MKKPPKLLPGSPDQLGSIAADNGVRFAVYSEVAERVELCLFDASGHETARYDLPDSDNGVWHGFLADGEIGQQYGYRVHGPYSPVDGLYCNPDKLLLDPYARLLAGRFDWHDAVFGQTATGERNRLNSAAHVPRSVVAAPDHPPGSAHPAIPWDQTIFYETNLRGFTMQHPALDATARGRFAGLQHAEVIRYLKALGITAVELMPVHAFIDEHHLARQGLRNFWGYNSIAFFAPANRYANDDPIAEFKSMVDALHDAQLEVILDVVYNHTGESDGRGPTLSFRGLDNLAYYRVAPDAPGEYINDTGTGNTINADHPQVQDLIVESLAYWHQVMGVDGFRFDLAPVLGRHADGFSAAHPLLKRITEEPRLARAKLIAEPWDPGPGGYQLGQFPSRWGEWNDQYRDSLRRFWRGDTAAADLAARLRGSSDVFEPGRTQATASVNFVTSHDGFTLADVVSYEQRHNEANGEENRDGHRHNYSLNYGVEGPSDDPDVIRSRRRHRLNLLASLLVSQGTPMLLAGDELGHTQDGNNNAYAQDNETTWIDWSMAPADPEFLQNVRDIIALRQREPLLRIADYLHGEQSAETGVIRIDWYSPAGAAMNDSDWHSGRPLQKLLRVTGGKRGRYVLVLIAGDSVPITFRLPHDADWEIAFTTGELDAGKDGLITTDGPSVSVLLAEASANDIEA